MNNKKRKVTKHTIETKRKISDSIRDMFCVIVYHDFINGKCIWCGLKENKKK